jgi:transposase
MDSIKYIGLDVHKETVSIAVMNAAGKLVMESIIETKAITILQFMQGLRGNLCVTFEEGTWAAWLYDLLKPHVTKIVVCDPRRNALLKEGNKADRIDARKLTELLRAGLLRPVYHGENGIRTLKELARSYLTISKDLTRVMNRVKALYRSWGISCAGTTVYAPRHRSEWLSKITEAGVRRRAEFFYQQLDALQVLRQQARRDLLAESRKHGATKLLRQIPYIGPVRAALLIALIQTPHRFRTKRQLWTYSGLAIETHDSAQYRYVAGQLQRSKKPQQLRGLNENHNHDLKNIFKSAATKASGGTGPFHDFYQSLLAKGMRPSMARLTLTRKIAAIHFDHLEEGSPFRRRTTKRTSSLSVSGRQSIPGGGANRVVETLGFEGEYPSKA